MAENARSSDNVEESVTGLEEECSEPPVSVVITTPYGCFLLSQSMPESLERHQFFLKDRPPHDDSVFSLLIIQLIPTPIIFDETPIAQCIMT